LELHIGAVEKHRSALPFGSTPRAGEGSNMTLEFRPFEKKDYERVLKICIDAFTPHHALFEKTLGSEIFKYQYQNWKEEYADYLGKFPSSDLSAKIYVAEEDAEIVGFVVTSVDIKRKVGEIGLNAVDPAHQGRGIGKAMYAFALDDLKKRGAKVAYVGTGADAAHAPARAAYRAVGFDKAIPSLHYFRSL
jgi:ribosomal protein S18 acetylase RimI-like enzyme